MHPITRRAILVGLLFPSALALAGDLTPPAGAPASTMKTLQQVEPRTPINSTTTPGNATARFRITQPGSYYLTGNIAGVAGKAGVRIESADVTLDLNGFTITGGEFGVAMDGFGLEGITVRNGSIADAANNGMALSGARAARVEEVTVRGSAAAGFFLGEAARLSRCVSRGNQFGYYTQYDGVEFRDCVASGNLSHGFRISGGAAPRFESCYAEANGGYGIDCDAVSDAVINECIARSNGASGVRAGSRALVTNCKLSGNLADGLTLSSFCVARHNQCDGNGAGAENVGAGIRITSVGSRIEDNAMTTNDYGILTDGGSAIENVIIRNSARANFTSNFQVAPANELATVVTNPGTNGFSTATPWSNFAY